MKQSVLKNDKIAIQSKKNTKNSKRIEKIYQQAKKPVGFKDQYPQNQHDKNIKQITNAMKQTVNENRLKWLEQKRLGQRIQKDKIVKKIIKCCKEQSSLQQKSSVPKSLSVHQKNKNSQKSESVSESSQSLSEQISEPEKYRTSYSEGGRQQIQSHPKANEDEFVDMTKPHRIRYFYKFCQNDPSKVINYKVIEPIIQQPSNSSQKSSSIQRNQKIKSINSLKRKIQIPSKSYRESDSQSNSNSKEKSTLTSNHISTKSKNTKINKNPFIGEQKQKNPQNFSKLSKLSQTSKNLVKNIQQRMPKQQQYQIIEESSSQSESCKIISNQIEIKKIKKNIQSSKIKNSSNSSQLLNLRKNSIQDSKKKLEKKFSPEKDKQFKPNLKKHKKTQKNTPKTKKIQKQKNTQVSDKKKVQQKCKQKQTHISSFFDAVLKVTPKKQNFTKNKIIEKPIYSQKPMKKNEKNEKEQKKSHLKEFQDEKSQYRRLKKDSLKMKIKSKNNYSKTEIIDPKKEQPKKDKYDNVSQEYQNISSNSNPELNFQQKSIIQSSQIYPDNYSHFEMNFKLDNNKTQAQNNETLEKVEKNIKQNNNYSQSQIQSQLKLERLPDHQDFSTLRINKSKKIIQNQIHQEPKALNHQIQAQKDQIDWFQDIWDDFPKRQRFQSQQIDILLQFKEYDEKEKLNKDDCEQKKNQISIDPTFSEDQFMDFMIQDKPYQKQENEENRIKNITEEFLFKQEKKQDYEDMFNKESQGLRMDQIEEQFPIENQINEQKRFDRIEVIEQQQTFQFENHQYRQQQGNMVLEQQQVEQIVFYEIKKGNEEGEYIIDSDSSQQIECVANYCVDDEQGSEDGQLVIIERLCTKKRGFPIFFHPLKTQKKQAKVQYQQKVQYQGQQNENNKYQDNSCLLKKEYFNQFQKDSEYSQTLSEGQDRQINCIKNQWNISSYVEPQQGQILYKSKDQSSFQPKQQHISNYYDQSNRIQEEQSSEKYSQNNQICSESQGEMPFIPSYISEIQSKRTQRRQKMYNNSQNKIKKQNISENYSPYFMEIQSNQQSPQQSGQITPPQLPFYLQLKKSQQKKIKQIKTLSFNKTIAEHSKKINNQKNYYNHQNQLIQSEQKNKILEYPDSSVILRESSQRQLIQKPLKIQIKASCQKKQDSKTNIKVPSKQNNHQQKQKQKINTKPKLTLQQQNFFQMLEEFTYRQEKIKAINKNKIRNLEIVDDDQEATKKMLQVQNQQNISQQGEDSLVLALQEMQRQFFQHQ